MTLFGPEPIRDWKMGYSLEHLRRYSEVFRERHKPLVFGAFGMVLERDIAAALAADRLLSVEEGGQVQAVALYRVLRRPSEWRDFRGEVSHTLCVGELFIEAIAARSIAAAKAVLRQAEAKLSSVSMSVEAFVEDEIVTRSLQGYQWMGSKVEAGSEIKGLYCLSGVHGLEFATHGQHQGLHGHYAPEEEATLQALNAEWLLPIQVQHVRSELAAAALQLWEQHYSSYNKRRSWTSFALRGYSDDPRFIIKPTEMAKSWRESHPREMLERPRWTSVAGLFPKTIELVKGLGFELDRVRFMRLRAGDGELSRHADITDREAGVADGRVARLHCPVYTSGAVTFYGWTAHGERLERKFSEGSLFYLDQRKPHAVKNEDPALDRVHLVIDCLSDDRLRRALTKSVREHGI